MQPKFSIALMILLFILNSFYGCGSLKKEPVNKRYFDLDIPRPIPSQDKICETAILLIKEFDITPSFDTLSFVYRLKKNEYAVDYYNEFITSPAGLITREIKKTLCPKDHLTIGQAKTKQNTGFRLSGNIIRFYGDFQDSSNPKAVIEIHMILEKKDGPAFHTMVSNTYLAEENISSHDPSELVTGWNTGLLKIIIKFIRDFQTQLP